MYLPDINTWGFQDLCELPSEENNTFEYKSSKISFDLLRNKISIAASAFWNSGGGIFIVGVNDKGEVDGGISDTIGRQKICDWVDQAVKATQPIGRYECKAIPIDNGSEGAEGKVVLVIKFYESSDLPHMAYDNRYYIRVGAHSASANHFQIEALRALRSFSRPLLKGVMMYHPTKPKVEELVIVAVNDAVALDVQLTFDPFPNLLEKHFKDYFPLEVSLIDKNTPFKMEVSLFGAGPEAFGHEPVKLILSYKDVLGNEYHTNQLIGPRQNLPPMLIGEDIYTKLVKAINNLADKLELE